MKSEKKFRNVKSLTKSETAYLKRSYAAYEKHYANFGMTHAMMPKYSLQSYLESLDKIRIRAKSQKNYARVIANSQQQIDYKLASHLQHRIRSAGFDPPSLKEMYNFNKMTYTINGKEETAESPAQALYMYIVGLTGTDIANEWYGY